MAISYFYTTGRMEYASSGTVKSMNTLQTVAATILRAHLVSLFVKRWEDDDEELGRLFLCGVCVRLVASYG